MCFRTHWVVLPDMIVPGRPLPITFNFFNTTQDVMVQVDLLNYDHDSIVSTRHTFANGKLYSCSLVVGVEAISFKSAPNFR